MNPIEHFEVPHLALLKSAVTHVLAKELGQSDTNANAIDTDHPLMQGTDIYCKAFEENRAIPEPTSDKGDDPEVQAYLAQLYHQKVHASIGGDAALEAAIAAQTARFKYGNPLWQQMFEQYYKYYWQYPWHEGRQPEYRSWRDKRFGRGDLSYSVIPWRLPANARVAIVGDIGTGTDEAAAVLLSALSFKPDAILHLGDIYFSGTEDETRNRFIGMIRDVMRSTGHRVPFFSVPGNHEYFTGGASYLRALDSGCLVELAEQRQSASYFCLRSEDSGWQFLGLDTGYYGHYMNVATGAQQATLDRLHIGKVQVGANPSNPHWPRHHNPYFRHSGDPSLAQKDTTAPVDQVTVRADEAAWHTDKLQKFPGRSVLLSHHQLYSALDVCGVAQRQITPAASAPAPDAADLNRIWVNTGLWQQFGPAFGDKVAAWMWGHEHNLNIFQSNYRPADWPATTSDAWNSKTLPKGRCAGHSAIPVDEILEQGEGSLLGCMFAGKGSEDEASHYNRFAEIYYGANYVDPVPKIELTPATEKLFYTGREIPFPDVVNTLAVPADGYAKILALDPNEAAVTVDLTAFDGAFSSILSGLHQVWNGPHAASWKTLGGAVHSMVDLRVLSCFNLLRHQVPEAAVAQLAKLYPDEYPRLAEYSDLSQPLFYGPRFFNVNIT